MTALQKRDFLGFRRDNGRVGIRNHVVILPLDDLSNAACEKVANNIDGCMALPHHYGRLQFGEDLELHFRTLIGTGSNPNVAAVVVIGIEPGWTGRVVDGIAKTGKPVEGFAIEGHGEIKVVADASRKAKEFAQWASELRREPCGLNDLWISTKCGESDTTSGLASNPTVGNLIDKLDAEGATTCFGETSELTGAEQVCATRAASPEVAEKFLATWQAYMDEVIEPHKTSDLSESQPTKGNIAGGLTTIEEKGLRQPAEDRQAGQVHRRAGTCRGAGEGTGPLLHGLLFGGRGVRHPAGGGRFHRAPLPDRSGQHHRQSDRAGDQAQRQPQDRARDGRAHRSRLLGDPSGRDGSGSGRRRVDRHHAAHLQRASHRRGSPEAPRVRDDEAFIAAPEETVAPR